MEVIDLSDQDIADIKAKLAAANFSTWPQFYSAEEVYDNWYYGIETMDGAIYSNMLENLPENEVAWKLFAELFSYTMYFPQLTK